MVSISTSISTKTMALDLTANYDATTNTFDVEKKIQNLSQQNLEGETNKQLDEDTERRNFREF